MSKGSLTPNPITYIELRKSRESGKWYARNEKGQAIPGTKSATAEEAARRATAPKYEPSKHS